MRVLFTTQPAYGHLHPLVQLAHGLERGGHDVAFACSPSFAPAIERLGFRCFPGGFDWLESDAAASFPELREMALDEQARFFVTRIFPGVTAGEMAHHVLDVAKRWRFDLVLCEMYECGGFLAAQQLRLPHVTVGLGDFTPREVLIDLVGPRIEEHRVALGLAPDPELRELRRHLYLNFAPPWFVQTGEDAHALRPLVFDASGEDQLPDWVDAPSPAPTIYVTMGTVFNKTPGVFEAILAGLRDESARVIVTVGRDRDPAEFGPQPPNVHIERYLPQSALLPFCDVLVSHGGYNTVMAALEAGVPQLTIPLSADQPRNARRCAERGVGLTLPLDALDSERVRRAVRELLSNPTYRKAARAVAYEMRALPGPEHAVALIERTAAAGFAPRAP